MEQGTGAHRHHTYAIDSKANAFAIAAHIHNDLGVGRTLCARTTRIHPVALSEKRRKAAPWPHRTDFLPGFGMNANLTGWADLFAGVHRGFSPVAPGQSPDVSAETSWNYELSAPMQAFNLSYGFINDYTNLTGHAPCQRVVMKMISVFNSTEAKPSSSVPRPHSTARCTYRTR